MVLLYYQYKKNGAGTSNCLQVPIYTTNNTILKKLQFYILLVISMTDFKHPILSNVMKTKR